MIEELKQKAEEYSNHNDWFGFSASVDKIGNAIRTKIERAYIAGATETTKELQKENKELKERESELKKQLELYRQQDKEVWTGVVAKANKFLHGATEKSIKWHDLRKDPNDLPNEEKDVLVYSGEQWRMSVCRYFPQHKAWEAGSDTIAWCEIPTFKE